MNLENAFRIIRESYFNRHIRRTAHEREWETEEQEDTREQLNEELRRNYDLQTQAIIDGSDNYSITPDVSMLYNMENTSCES
jgi:hypothetical protein